MKSTIGKLTAGIGYGFLFGAAAGLIAGVVLDRLFFWTIIGMAAGLVIGIAICCSRAAGNCRRQSRFEQSGEVRDAGQADKLEP
ncbi:MAG: hypothetical protein KAU49_06460 [Candidatus Krumholzibacteria bacterium]|nr:hypothetical protein [Candidatus Krumholzibacteria bacterium]